MAEAARGGVAWTHSLCCAPGDRRWAGGTGGRSRASRHLLSSSDGSGACPVVKEWFVYAGNPLQQPDLVRPLQMNLPGAGRAGAGGSHAAGWGPPNLKLLWLGQEPEVQARRVDALLACFDLSSAREELQALEGPLQALCCLLTYLFVQVDTLTLEDLHAFLAQALCLPGWSTAQLADLELDHVDSRAVQLGALLMRGLTTLLLVNSACGSPWRAGHFMPWNLFDGKLFHQKYLQSERGYTVEELVEQNATAGAWWGPDAGGRERALGSPAEPRRVGAGCWGAAGTALTSALLRSVQRARLTQFHALKSAVCKACAKENRRIVSGQRWRAHHTAGRWGRQGSSSYRTSSGHSRSSPGQHWRDQGP
ncbi:Constitutive coactivator of peroxisome proliferator-activated receptor gamma, partial [Galemys pyrenaicus]